MRADLHMIMTKALTIVVLFTVFHLTSCAASSAHGAGQYFEGKALELAIASESGDAKTIQRLMKEEGVNPDVEFSSRDGIPLVAWPLRAQNIEGLRSMLENGADPNARQTKKLQGRDVRFDNAMVYAAEMEDSRYLALLLKHGGNPDTRNSNNETLLYQAFISGNQWQNVQLLVENGADINESNRGSADTVLSWYTTRGAFKHAYWLLEHGADPTIMLTPPKVSGKPDRMIMAEHIYWEITTPDLLPWQKKCQQWLIARGIPRPPMPSGIRAKREAFKYPSREEDIPLL